MHRGLGHVRVISATLFLVLAFYRVKEIETVLVSLHYFIFIIFK